MAKKVFGREQFIKSLLLIAALSSLLFLLIIFAFILGEGLPLFYKAGVSNIILGSKWAPTKGFFGIFPMIVSSFMVTFGSLFFGAPLALGCAIYLSEYASRKTKMVLKPALELLAGIPSVVYGFLGVVYIVPIIREYLGGPGFSILATSVVLGIMILPTIISISFDSLMSVPPTYREASVAMGATKWQTIYNVVLPAAQSGILASFILGMGRAIGETMAVIMVAGNALRIPMSVLDPLRTLTSNIALELAYAAGDHRSALFSTGVVLFIIIMTLNLIANFWVKEGSRLRLNPRYTDKFVRGWLVFQAFFTVSILVLIVLIVFVKGAANITPQFILFYPEDMGRHGGIFPAIIGTIFLAVLSIALATPLGVGTAIYLTEYTKESTLTRVIRFGVESLAGIPSIIYGLFGFIFFVVKLKLGWSLISGTLTIMIMVLPTIIRTAEEAIKAVPRNLRIVSFSLGATKWETVTKVVLPSAAPGILTGIMLSVGRAVSETAAVIFTMGSSLRLPTSLLDPGRTMAVHFYILAREGISLEKAYATAFVLVVSILLINIAAYYTMNRMISKYS